MKWKIYHLTVGAAEQGQRLDQYLAAAVADMSRGRARKIIDIGGVHVNGRRVRSCSTPVKMGDTLELYLDHLPLEPFRFSAEQVLFRDKYLVIVNKPAGIDTQPTHARFKGTVYEALQVLLYNSFRPQQKPELGMVQRLDRGTTGLMVFSIHPQAHRGLTKIFVEHQAGKRYLALVAGSPQQDQGEIRSHLARTRSENRVVSVERGGKEAITRFAVAERFAAATLLEIELLTGRSHQIRAHMAEHGCPLLGDSRYGGREDLAGLTLERPLLHAAGLEFVHPVTNQPMVFTAPLPSDMQRLLELLRSGSVVQR